MKLRGFSLKYFRLLCLTALTIFVMLMIFVPSGSDAEDAQSARIGNDYYPTLNDALEAASAKDVVIVLDGCTLTSDATVPKGVTLLVPYTDGMGDVDLDGIQIGPDPTIDNKYRKKAGDGFCVTDMTIDAGVKLTVLGKVIIGGIISEKFTFDYQGHTWGDHGKITLKGDIVMQDGSELRCYGYIKGNGNVIASSGSKVYEPFILTDFVGGDHMRDMYDEHQSPFNRYSFSNIESKISLKYGSKLIGMVTLYANSSIMQTDFNIVGDKRTGNSMIDLADGSVAEITYDGKKYVEANWESNIYRDIGKTMITISGGADFDSVKLSYGGRSVNTSDVVFSIPYNFDYILSNGEYNINSSYRLLPGSSMTVAADAKLTVNDELQIYNGLEDVIYKDKYYPGADILEKYNFSTHGTLCINGELYVSKGSRVLGIIESEGNGKVNIDMGALKDEGIKVTYGVDSNTVRTMSTWAFGKDGSLVVLKVGSTTTLDNGISKTDGFTYIKGGKTVTKPIEQIYNGTIGSTSGGIDPEDDADSKSADMSAIAIFAVLIIGAVAAVSAVVILKKR